MAAKIEFHDRYWKNVSQEGVVTSCITPCHGSHVCWIRLAKQFIKSLLKPDPTKRPTAAAALANHVRNLVTYLSLELTRRSGSLFTLRPPRLTCQVCAKTSIPVPAGSPPSTPPGLSSGSTQAPAVRNSIILSGQRSLAMMTTTMTTFFPFRPHGNRALRLRNSLPGRLDQDWMLRAQKNLYPRPLLTMSHNRPWTMVERRNRQNTQLRRRRKTLSHNLKLSRLPRILRECRSRRMIFPFLDPTSGNTMSSRTASIKSPDGYQSGLTSIGINCRLRINPVHPSFRFSSC